MKNEAGHAQLRELVEDHLSRGAPQDMGIAALAVGLGAIGAALAEVQSGRANWSAVRERLRQGMKDTRAGLQIAHADRRLDALRGFAERQLTFAALLDDEIVRVTAGETTLA